MKIKNKILLIFVMSLLLVGGGGYYLLGRFHKDASRGTGWYELAYSAPGTQLIIPDYYDNLPKFRKGVKTSTQNPETPNPAMSFPGLTSGARLGENGMVNGKRGLRPMRSSSAGAMKGSRQAGDEFYSAGGSGILASSMGGYSGASQASSEGAGSYGGSASLSMSMTAPLAVPFSNNYNGTPPATSGGTILFDPGSATTAETDANTIPAGEGCWILALMGVGYLGYRRLKV